MERDCRLIMKVMVMAYTSDVLIINSRIVKNMSKIYKAVFTAQVHTVSLALKFPCVVSVTWRRGNFLIYFRIKNLRGQVKEIDRKRSRYLRGFVRTLV